MSNTSVLARITRNIEADNEFSNAIGFNPLIRFYADLTDMRGGKSSTFLRAKDYSALGKIIGEEPAQFLNEIGLLVQVLPGTPVTIDNAHSLRGEYDYIKHDPSLRKTLPIFDLVPEQIKRIYEKQNFNAYPMSKKAWDEMPPEIAKNFSGWNGYNFHVDSVAIAPDSHVSITLKLTPNKLLNAEMEARESGLIPDEYSARQFHSSVICICQDAQGKRFLVVQAKNVWANNGGDVDSVDIPGKKLRLYHPALVAGGVEPEKFFSSDDQKLVANPGLFGALDQASHEIGVDFASVGSYKVSDPVALLHEGICGENKPNKLPSSLYCNIQHVMQRVDGSPIKIEEILALQEIYAKEIYAPAQGRGPEVRGCAFIPLDDGDFKVIKTRDSKGNEKSSFCVTNAETVAISFEGEIIRNREDVVIDSAYTGVLKHLFVKGDELRELVFDKAGCE